MMETQEEDHQQWLLLYSFYALGNGGAAVVMVMAGSFLSHVKSYESLV